MTYAKERYTKASVALQYAEAGFEKSVRESAKILEKCTVDDVPDVLEQLKLEYEILKEAREDLERAKRYLEEREAISRGC